MALTTSRIGRRQGAASSLRPGQMRRDQAPLRVGDVALVARRAAPMMLASGRGPHGPVPRLLSATPWNQPSLGHSKHSETASEKARPWCRRIARSSPRDHEHGIADDFRLRRPEAGELRLRGIVEEDHDLVEEDEANKGGITHSSDGEEISEGVNVGDDEPGISYLAIDTRVGSANFFSPNPSARLRACSALWRPPFKSLAAPQERR